MELETKFLRLPRPVAVGKQIDGWQVCWLGGWDKARIFFFVMVSVSLIGGADASFARFAPENAGSVWECAGSALITCPPYVCQMSRPRLFGAS